LVTTARRNLKTPANAKDQELRKHMLQNKLPAHIKRTGTNTHTHTHPTYTEKHEIEMWKISNALNTFMYFFVVEVLRLESNKEKYIELSTFALQPQRLRTKFSIEISLHRQQ